MPNPPLNLLQGKTISVYAINVLQLTGPISGSNWK